MFNITITSVVKELKEKYNSKQGKIDFDYSDLTPEELLEYGEICFSDEGLLKESPLALIISIIPLIISIAKSLDLWAIILFAILTGLLLVLSLVYYVSRSRNIKKIKILREAKFIYDVNNKPKPGNGK